MENACCEFDVETLRPTYRLLIGIPGKSNAFAISKRLGLQEYILSAAKEFISRDEARFEDVITDLEISKKSVKFEQERAEEYRREHLADALMKIPYMLCVDEYQHKVFENPEMTTMERRAVWSGLEKIYMPWRNYAGNEFLESGAFWIKQQHIFLYPFYYVDYAMAQMGAFEFYTKMKEDRKAAWADYYKLCAAGGSMGYFDLLKYSGLHKVLEDGSVKIILKGVFEELGL